MNPAFRSVAHGRINRQALARQVQALIAGLRPDVTVERRYDDRFPVPLLFRLTPLNHEGEPVPHQSVTVVGKDISQRGLSFFHEQPLPYRRAIVSLEHPELGCFAAEIDVYWCRFTGPGWYVSGGRLMRAVETGNRPWACRTDAANWAGLELLGDGACS